MIRSKEIPKDEILKILHLNVQVKKSIQISKRRETSHPRAEFIKFYDQMEHGILESDSKDLKQQCYDIIEC